MIGATRPRLTLAAVTLLTLLCALLALRLQPSTGIDTLVSRSSADYRATQVDDRQFGSAPVVLLVRLPLTALVPLFTHSGHHHIPVVDASRRLVGIITQTDLVTGLYQQTQILEAA